MTSPGNSAEKLASNVWLILLQRGAIFVLCAAVVPLSGVAWAQYNDVQTLKAQAAKVEDVSILKANVQLLQYQTATQAAAQAAIQAQLSTILDKLGTVQSSVAGIEGQLRITAVPSELRAPSP